MAGVYHRSLSARVQRHCRTCRAKPKRQRRGQRPAALGFGAASVSDGLDGNSDGIIAGARAAGRLDRSARIASTVIRCGLRSTSQRAMNDRADPRLALPARQRMPKIRPDLAVDRIRTAWFGRGNRKRARAVRGSIQGTLEQQCAPWAVSTPATSGRSSGVSASIVSRAWTVTATGIISARKEIAGRSIVQRLSKHGDFAASASTAKRWQ